MRVKNLPATQETQVRSLGQEDPLEKEMTTHSSILAWRIPWTEESGELQSSGLQSLEHDWKTKAKMWAHVFLWKIWDKLEKYKGEMKNG